MHYFLNASTPAPISYANNPPADATNLDCLTHSTFLLTMASMNENFAAAARLIPRANAPVMVAPERVIPGANANAWHMPTIIASA